MKAAKTQLKEIERNSISTTKKSFEKEKEIVLHQQRQIPQFHKLVHNAWNRPKKKVALHEVNFGGAAKISTIFYQ